MTRLNRLEGWTNGSAPSPDESPRTFLIMLVMPWANIAVCLLLARLVRCRAPRLYAVLTGGRS